MYDGAVDPVKFFQANLKFTIWHMQSMIARVITAWPWTKKCYDPATRSASAKNVPQRSWCKRGQSFNLWSPSKRPPFTASRLCSSNPARSCLVRAAQRWPHPPRLRSATPGCNLFYNHPGIFKNRRITTGPFTTAPEARFRSRGCPLRRGQRQVSAKKYYSFDGVSKCIFHRCKHFHPSLIFAD
jgi:hypothetical protein